MSKSPNELVKDLKTNVKSITGNVEKLIESAPFLGNALNKVSEKADNITKHINEEIYKVILANIDEKYNLKLQEENERHAKAADTILESFEHSANIVKIETERLYYKGKAMVQNSDTLDINNLDIDSESDSQSAEKNQEDFGVTVGIAPSSNILINSGQSTVTEIGSSAEIVDG